MSNYDEDDVREVRGLPHSQPRWGERDHDNGDAVWNRKADREEEKAPPPAETK